MRTALPLALLSCILATLICAPVVVEHLSASHVSQNPLLRSTAKTTHGHAQVLETLRASHYVYARLSSSPSGHWHVVLGEGPHVGQQVQYKGYAYVDNFRSSRLSRTFDRVTFSTISPIP